MKTTFVSFALLFVLLINSFAQDAPKHTASKNVRIISEDFYMPQLGKNRRIWAYLPEDYRTNTSKKYPVLYMHDGQNLFDAATAPFGEWGIDELLDSIGLGKMELIVIGIDHGGDSRLTEYNAYDNEQFGKGLGNLYSDFLVKTLKPYIDLNYRTLPGAKHTFIAGSSMGGLISLTTVMRYPKTFGVAGIFSPAFWTAPGLSEDVKKLPKSLKIRLFFYMGGTEGAQMVQDMYTIEKLITRRTHCNTNVVFWQDGKHNEATWHKVFPLFLEYLF